MKRSSPTAARFQAKRGEVTRTPKAAKRPTTSRGATGNLLEPYRCSGEGVVGTGAGGFVSAGGTIKIQAPEKCDYAPGPAPDDLTTDQAEVAPFA